VLQGAVGEGDGDGTVAAHVARVNTWCLGVMPLLNRDILQGRRPWTDFRDALTRDVLPPLPAAPACTPAQARRLVVAAGLAGAALGRHYQEGDERNRDTPEAAFDGVAVGPARQPFGTWFTQLAERTGTGHGPRDTYASLVRWNVPAVEVRWAGRQLAHLGSAFDDGQVRSYTGTPDEVRFFGLLKGSEVIERAVNDELMPLSDGAVDLADPEAVARVGRGVVLLDVLRRMNQAFATRSPEEGLRIGWFMDVFRQFAVHWRPGDVPPSGALDAEALIRDLLVGIALPAYPEHLRRVFPGLLAPEREELERLLVRPALPAAALRLAGATAEEIAVLPVARLAELVARHPILAALHLLLDAHARAGGVHLRLSKQFLFRPQRGRDEAGLGDPGVVSNRSGTTGMDERRLESLTRARRDHVLAGLGALPAARLRELAGMRDDPRTGQGPEAVTVAFLDTDIPGYELGLPRPAATAGPPRQSRRTSLAAAPAGERIEGLTS
jgi:hypothetical protein